MSAKLTDVEYDKQLVELGIRATRKEPYKGAHAKILHDFWDCDCYFVLISPSNVKQGNGCGRCRDKKIGEANSHNTEVYKKILIDKGILNVEVLESYKGDNVKIWHNFLDCSCGPTNIEPAGVKQGRGCCYCGQKRMKETQRHNTEIYKKALIERGIINVEVLGVYVSSHTKILHNFLDCDCDPVMIKPNNVKNGKGCGNCSGQISKIGDSFLNELENKKNIILKREFSFVPNDKRKKADGYDPVTNTIYEFYGDIWHGNPKTKEWFNKDEEFHKRKYKETIEREELIKKLGYNLITIWESDYKKEGINGLRL